MGSFLSDANPSFHTPGAFTWAVVLCVEKEDALSGREEEQTPIGNQPEQRCSGQRDYREDFVYISSLATLVSFQVLHVSTPHPFL